MVNKERMLTEFYELVKITCSSRNEREVANVLTKKLQSLGAIITEDQAGEKVGGNTGNLVAVFEGVVPEAPTVMLGAHMDCVEVCANIEPVLKDGLLTSSGNTILGSDDKSGVVGILEALRILKEKQLAYGKIVVIFTICEEVGLLGSHYIERELLKDIDFGYVLDSSGVPGKIINQAPGQNKLQIIVHGRKAHAGLEPEKGINAIVVAGAALAKVPQGRIDEETTANIGLINGGIATNIVPDEVHILAEARSCDPKKLETQTKAMVTVFETVAKEYGTTADVTVLEQYKPIKLPETAPVIAIAKDAAAKLGLPVAVVPTGGGSDANRFNLYGVPTAVLATGMTNAHTVNECMKEEHLYQCGEWVLEIVRKASEQKK